MHNKCIFMAQNLSNIIKVLLIAICLIIPCGMVAQENSSLLEMEQNQIVVTVSRTHLQVKNAEGKVLEIFSLIGEKVYTQRIESESRTYELSQLHKGYYIVKIGKFTRKIYLH